MQTLLLRSQANSEQIRALARATPAQEAGDAYFGGRGRHRKSHWKIVAFPAVDLSEVPGWALSCGHPAVRWSLGHRGWRVLPSSDVSKLLCLLATHSAPFSLPIPLALEHL